MVNHCCAIGCTKSSDIYKNIKFHRFPLDNLPLLQKWLRAVRRKDFTPTKSTRLCSDHFVKNDYCGSNLKCTAVPSNFNFMAANEGKSKKVFAKEQDLAFPNQLPEVYSLPDFSRPEQSSTVKIEWNPLEELGLDINQVELHFEDDIKTCLDEEAKLLHLGDMKKVSCNEKGTQTFISKCNTCVNQSDKFRLLRKQIKRRENKIIKLQCLISSLKKQIRDGKKRKIKIVGNNVILLHQFDNRQSLDNVSIDEQNQVDLSVS